MSSTDRFRALGLSRASATEADVKAAYAWLLKVTRPEDDGAAFMALRQVFDTARAAVRYNDRTRAAAAEAGVQAAPGEARVGQEIVADDAAAAPSGDGADAVPAEDVVWTYDQSLNWNFNSSPGGKLI